MKDIDNLKDALLKGEHSSFYISFNDHSANYIDANTDVLANPDRYLHTWVSDEERTLAMKNNSIWSLQWYPNTPIASAIVHASSFEAIFNYMKEHNER